MRGFCMLLGSSLIIASYLFGMGKGLAYIRAWRETSEEEKRRVNEKKLSKNLSGIFGFAGIIFSLAGLSSTFKERGFVWWMIVWLIVTGIDVHYIGKSQGDNLEFRRE